MSNTCHPKELHQVVSGLVNILGLKMTAYLAMVDHTSSVKQMIDPNTTKNWVGLANDERLRKSLEIAQIIASGDSRENVQAWFGGMNPHLNDRSPAAVLRTASQSEILAVLQAANALRDE